MTKAALTSDPLSHVIVQCVKHVKKSSEVTDDIGFKMMNGEEQCEIERIITCLHNGPSFKYKHTCPYCCWKKMNCLEFD